MKQVAVHVRCNAAGAIRREKRDGRETIVLPSYAAKANTVLNGILYPKDELETSYSGLNRTPAPLGHPTINGKFVPALDPEALARNHIFAWNENPRWVDDRIALDVVIDEARAKESEGGKKVLNAVEKQEPISTSTGLLCNLDETDTDEYKAVARNISWDHVALLLDEEPAISPDQGVGIFVNSACKDGDDVEVINSALEDADRELDWAVDHLARALSQRERVPMLERLKAAVMEVFTDTEREPSANRKEADMTVTKEQFDELSAKVNALTESVSEESLGKTIGEAVANAVKPLVEAQEEIKANQEAKDKAEKADLVAKIVKANILDEAEANELTLSAARKLAEKAKPGSAANLNSAFDGKSDDDEFKDYDLNANMEAK